MNSLEGKGSTYEKGRRVAKGGQLVLIVMALHVLLIN